MVDTWKNLPLLTSKTSWYLYCLQQSSSLQMTVEKTNTKAITEPIPNANQPPFSANHKPKEFKEYFTRSSQTNEEQK